jgi:hypothetical protein
VRGDTFQSCAVSSIVSSCVTGRRRIPAPVICDVEAGLLEVREVIFPPAHLPLGSDARVGAVGALASSRAMAKTTAVLAADAIGSVCDCCKTAFRFNERG